MKSVRGLELLFVAVVFFLSGCGKEPTVVTMTATATRVPFVYTATVMPEPLFHLPVMAEVSGALLSPLPAVGTKILAGELLAEIDSSAYDAQIESNKSRLAALDKEAAPAPDESREAVLFRQGIITQAEYEKLRKKPEAKESERKEAPASRESLLNALRAAQRAKDSCRVTAPVTGTVQKVYEKDMAHAGKPLLDLGQKTPVTAEVEIPIFMAGAVDYAKIHRKLTVSVIGEKTSQIWYGELKKESEETAGDYVIYRVQIENPDGKLLTGDPYTIRIDTGGTLKGILVPKAAVLEGNKVQIVNEDGLIDVRRVTLGKEQSGKCVILDGISEGVRIVTKADASLAIGTKVNAEAENDE